MPDIFSYIDYRRFLHDAYEERRGEGLSHRVIGAKGGFDPGLFSKVLSGERNITLKMGERFCLAFNLDGEQKEFFLLLVRFDREHLHERKKEYLDCILSHQKARIPTVVRDRYEYYDKWYYSVIRELLNYYEFSGDYTELARRLNPPITPAEARKAIRLLEKLGFIVREQSGACRLTQPLITTGHDTNSTVLAEFVQQGIDLAAGAVNRTPRESRNLSSLTMSVPTEKLPLLTEKIREFRREILEMIGTWEKQDAVYQLSMQLFPLTKPPKGESDE